MLKGTSTNHEANVFVAAFPSWYHRCLVGSRQAQAGNESGTTGRLEQPAEVSGDPHRGIRRKLRHGVNGASCATFVAMAMVVLSSPSRFFFCGDTKYLSYKIVNRFDRRRSENYKTTSISCWVRALGPCHALLRMVFTAKLEVFSLNPDAHTHQA